jgi:hypothetical protein
MHGEKVKNIPVIGLVRKGISGMDHCKVCESGETEIAIFLNMLALKCILFIVYRNVFKLSDLKNASNLICGFHLCAAEFVGQHRPSVHRIVS